MLICFTYTPIPLDMANYICAFICVYETGKNSFWPCTSFPKKLSKSTVPPLTPMVTANKKGRSICMRNHCFALFCIVIHLICFICHDVVSSSNLQWFQITFCTLWRGCIIDKCLKLLYMDTFYSFQAWLNSPIVDMKSSEWI